MSALQPDNATGAKRPRENDGSGRTAFERPAEAGEVEYAELWYYNDK